MIILPCGHCIGIRYPQGIYLSTRIHAWYIASYLPLGNPLYPLHITPYYTLADVNFIILLLLFTTIYMFFLLTPSSTSAGLSVRDGFHLITLKIETLYKTAYDRNNRVSSYPAMREILISTLERMTTVTTMVRDVYNRYRLPSINFIFLFQIIYIFIIIFVCKHSNHR